MPRAISGAPFRRGAVVLALVAAGCGVKDAVVGPAPRTDASQYWALTLNVHAVTMSTAAPYDTLQLVATPRGAAGNSLSGYGKAVFTSSDSSRIVADSNGVMHALKAGSGIRVIAKLASGSLTLSDTAMVNVTTLASPPKVAVYSIHPTDTTSDSAEAAAGDTRSLPLTVLDSAGNPIDAVTPHVTSSDLRVARIDYAGDVYGVRPGHFTVTATSTIYGVSVADSEEYVIGWPVGVVYLYTLQFANNQIAAPSMVNFTLGTGAEVWFVNQTVDSTDVTFSDPTAVDSSALGCFYAQFGFPWLCGTGNIAPFAADSNNTDDLTGIRMRTFPKPGTLTFRIHSIPFSENGSLTIIDWRSLR